jgi:hypothetical protein
VKYTIAKKNYHEEIKSLFFSSLVPGKSWGEGAGQAYPHDKSRYLEQLSAI